MNKTSIRRGFHIACAVFMAIVFLLSIARYVISFSFSISNYKHNQTQQVSGVIYNQSSCDNFKLGAGTVADYGCGIVAIYNILELDGKSPDLAKIIKKCDPFGTNFFALLGTNPLFIKRYLKKEGYKTKLCLSTKNLEKKAEDYRYVIYIYVPPKGGHYQLMVSLDDGNYKLINPGGYITIEDMNEDHKNELRGAILVK